MTGTLVNAAAIVVGSVIGGTFRRVLSERLSRALMDAMGLAAFALGVNAAVQNMPKSQYPVLFIVSLALGCLLGTLLRLDERVKGLTEKRGAAGLGQGILTGCLLFCIGTLSILGPVQSALYGDHTYLFTNAMMTEISIVGGLLIAMSGLSIMKIKAFPTLNYLPALIVPILWCLLRGAGA